MRMSFRTICLLLGAVTILVVGLAFMAEQYQEDHEAASREAAISNEAPAPEVAAPVVVTPEAAAPAAPDNAQQIREWRVDKAGYDLLEICM